MIKYIILNGPPSSGKTTIARELTTYLQRAGNVTMQDSFAMPLKHFIATALGEKYQEMDKEKIRPELNGISSRRFLVDLEENYLKALYGQDIFARWLMHRSLKNAQKKPDYVIIDDGRFKEEMEALPVKFLVRVVRNSKDGRYLPNPNYILHNGSVMADLWLGVEQLFKHLMKLEEENEWQVQV